MKKSSAIFWGIIVVIMVSVVAIYMLNQNKRYSWYLTLRAEGEQPYDLVAFHNMLENSARGDSHRKLARSLKVELNDIKENQKYTYVSVSNGFYPDTTEIKAFLDFLNAGNTVFISSPNISNLLPTAILYGHDSVRNFLKALESTNIYDNVPDSVLEKYDDALDWSDKDSIHDTYTQALRHKMYEQRLVDSISFGSSKLTLVNKNHAIDLYYYKKNIQEDRNWEAIFLPKNPQIKTVATFPNGAPGTIDWQIGKGHLIINSTPIIFTNYYLKEQKNFDFVNQHLAILPKGTFLIDDIKRYNDSHNGYNPKGNLGQSPLTFILGQPALKWAWYVLLGTVLLFVLFKSKRKQRIIPILKPNLNTTLAYAKMMGSLQLKDKDNRAKGEEIAQLFMQHLRSKNRWHGTEVNEDLKILLIKLMPDLNREIQIVIHLLNKSKSSKTLSDQEIINFFNFSKLILQRI